MAKLLHLLHNVNWTVIRSMYQNLAFKIISSRTCSFIFHLFWYFPQIQFNQILLLMWASLKAFHLPISQLLPSLKNEYSNSKAVGYSSSNYPTQGHQDWCIVCVNVTLGCVCTRSLIVSMFSTVFCTVFSTWLDSTLIVPVAEDVSLLGIGVWLDCFTSYIDLFACLNLSWAPRTHFLPS